MENKHMGHLNYKGYTGTVEYSEEDNILFGKVEGLNKVLISYEGTTVDELKADFEGAVDDYLNMCEERGKKPAKPYSGTFNVRLTPELHSQIAAYAKKAGESLNSFVRKAVEHELRNVSF